MKKFRVKRFIIVFFILMIVQFLIGLLNIYSYKQNDEMSIITSFLMTIFSFPVGLINRDLPFYINDGLPIKVILWIINVFLQTALILGGISLFRSVKEKLEY